MLTIDQAANLRRLHAAAVKRGQEWDRTLPGTPAKTPRAQAHQKAEAEFEQALLDLVERVNPLAGVPIPVHIHVFDAVAECEHCHGTGGHMGAKGGPGGPLCGWCRGTGKVPA